MTAILAGGHEIGHHGYLHLSTDDLDADGQRAELERIWLEEFESARQEHRAITYTMHPEAVGRGYLIQMLRRVIVGMLGHGRPWFATHAQIAALANEPAAGCADLPARDPLYPRIQL